MNVQMCGNGSQRPALGSQLDNLAHPGLTAALRPCHDDLLASGDPGANTSR
jgi:hypothetical protein